MPKRDLYSNVDVAVSLAPAVRSANADGSSVDLRGSDSAMIIVNVGAEGVTLSSSVWIEVELEESDDGSLWAAVDGSDIQGADSGTLARYDSSAELPAIARFGYLGTARYIRAVWKKSGAQATGTAGSVVVVRGNLRQRPASA